MSDAAALQARLVGALFVDRGLLTADQLEHALEIQSSTGELLGEVLITEFGISRIELASVLAEQWAELETQELPAEAAPDQDDADGPHQRRIGEIFVERGFVTQSELDHALDVQPGSGRPLGEVLIDLGSLSRMELASALAEQWSGLEKLRPPAPKPVEAWQQVAPAAHAAAAAQGASRNPEQAVTVARDPELGAAVAALGQRVAAMEASAADDGWAAEIRTAIDALAGRIVSVEVSLPAASSNAEELADLRTMLAELQERIAVPEERLATFEQRLVELVDDDGVAERLMALETRTAEAQWSGELAELRAALETLALAGQAGPEERLASLESRLEELAAAEQGLEKRAVEQAALDGVSEQLAALETRMTETPWSGERAELRAALEVLESAPEERLASVESRVQKLATTLDARVAETPWSGELAKLRAALEELRVAPEERLAAVESRLQELVAAERRLEKRVLEQSPLDGFADRLAAIETRALEAPWQQEISDLRESVTSLAEEPRGRADLTAVNELRDELGALRRSTATGGTAVVSRFDTLSTRIDDLSRRTDAVAAAEEAGAFAVDAALQEARVLGEERAAASAAALTALDSKLRGRLDALAADVASGEDVEAVAIRVDASLDALGGRVTATEESVAAASDAMGAAIAAVSAHLGSDLTVAAERLGALEEAVGRLAESHPVGAAELEAALDATEARLGHRAAAHEEAMAVLRRRLEEIAAMDGVLADRMHGVATELGASLEGVTAGLAHQAAVADEAAAVTAMRLGAIEESLASRPDPEDVVRPALANVHARIETVEAAAAAAAQAGDAWSGAADAFDARVTVVEAALFSRDAVLDPRLSALERRLEQETSQADERARTVDRALRKGLASLGERLAESEAAYFEAGSALRSSIERLGRAVTDADVRIAARATPEDADRARFDADAFVAFVPTPEGYRLVAVEAALPAVDDIVELDGHGCLRVGRLGASPIPLDTRACAYLEAPDDVPDSSDA